MRLLVFGGAGIVGRAMVAEAGRRGWAVDGPVRDRTDVTDAAAVADALAAFRPGLVVNCAAMTAVDACEREREQAFRLNGDAVGILAAAAARAGARFVHISTDYVFDGEGAAPYAEDHPTAPRSVYGASKLEGERLALAVPGTLLVRTSWIFGHGGANFVDTMRAKMAAPDGPLSVVADQVGAPTWAPFLARALADLGESGADGIVHYQNRPAVSWYEFALEIARRLGSAIEIRPATSAEVPRPAPRPRYSVLAVERFERLAGRPVEDWREGLAEHLKSCQERR
ncbi:MAG: dTDP-4-dehydrorhamnose reductase [Thermoanaerobaculia bacterium]|nr:MAG: dTDP-4-dehydrorhamnose reductase [Thermoanaerobaculia bacterium]